MQAIVDDMNDQVIRSDFFEEFEKMNEFVLNKIEFKNWPNDYTSSFMNKYWKTAKDYPNIGEIFDKDEITKMGANSPWLFGKIIELGHLVPQDIDHALETQIENILPLPYYMHRWLHYGNKLGPGFTYERFGPLGLND